MTTLYRAQILLEPEQHQVLREIARSDDRSVSEIVREIVRQYLEARGQDDRRLREMQAIEKLAQIREQIREQHGVYQGNLLEEIRAEREQDVEVVWRGQE